MRITKAGTVTITADKIMAEDFEFQTGGARSASGEIERWIVRRLAEDMEEKGPRVVYGKES